MPTILTKKSDTPGAVPATADLTNAAGGAELAVNTADKRLFTISSASAIVELGTNPSSISTPDASATVLRASSATITNLLATSASITTLTNNPTFGAGTANGVLYLNGSKVATSGSALTFDGTNLGIGTASPVSRLTIYDNAPAFTMQTSRTFTANRNWQIGVDTFAEGNWTLTPSTTLGGNTYTTPALIVNPSGNLGLGVTPSAYNAGPAFDFGERGGLAYYGTLGAFVVLSNNVYWNSGYKYKANAGAAQLNIGNDGSFAWFTAPSGTAGNTISFTQAMTLDASGRLALGRTSATNYGAGATTFSIDGSAGGWADFYYNGTRTGIITAESGAFVLDTTTGKPLVFKVEAVERARITSGGDLLVGTTTAQNARLVVEAKSGGYIIQGTNSNAVTFQIEAGGNVQNANNSYGAISDEKVKQDIVDAASQWEDIKSLRVRKFRLKSDATGPMQIGLVAQEAETVSPGLVDAAQDYEEIEITDEEGNVTKERQPTGTVTKSVKYSVLYMKAIKALQEAMSRIEDLEAKVAALEAK